MFIIQTYSIIFYHTSHNFSIIKLHIFYFKNSNKKRCATVFVAQRKKYYQETLKYGADSLGVATYTSYPSSLSIITYAPVIYEVVK